jgi:aspartate kinase
MGHATTLGREGSDFTAAIFAWALNAKEATIWKDVPGVMNADPRKFNDTILFKELSYRDAVEMSYYGASVLHPKTMQPLQNRGIPLNVRSFVNPDETGTTVSADIPQQTEIPVFIAKENQCLVSIASNNFSFIAEHNLSTIFNAIAQSRVKINLMRNSAMRFTFCTDNDERKLNVLKAALEPEFNLEIKPNLRLLTARNANSETRNKLVAEYDVLLEQRIERVRQYVVKA